MTKMKPAVLDLNMTEVNPQMTRVYRAAPLPDGGAFLYYYDYSNITIQVVGVNITGQVIQHVHQCVKCNEYSLTGLLLLGSNLYVIHSNGTLLEININNIKMVQVYRVPSVKWMTHWGSLSYHPSVIINHHMLLLVDQLKNEIFSFNISSKQKVVHLTDLPTPTSVSFMTYKSVLYYVVCVFGSHQVRVYNSTWGLYKTLGNVMGYYDGYFRFPVSAVGLTEGFIIISDSDNYRISEFNIDKSFVRHLLTMSDGLSRPGSMSICLPHIWVGENGRFYRYIFHFNQP